jgi:hypothetical protein
MPLLRLCKMVLQGHAYILMWRHLHDINIALRCAKCKRYTICASVKNGYFSVQTVFTLLCDKLLNLLNKIVLCLTETR